MLITTLIHWSNNNIGFITAVFSFLTIFLSSISVIIAVKAIRAPYKKSLKMNVSIGFKILVGYNSLNEQIPYISVTAINRGNRVIQLTDLCLYCNKARLTNTQQCISNKKINPSDIFTIDYDRYDSSLFPMISSEQNRSKFKNKKWYGYAKDTEGKEYKVRSKEFEKIVDKILAE